MRRSGGEILYTAAQTGLVASYQMLLSKSEKNKISMLLCVGTCIFADISRTIDYYHVLKVYQAQVYEALQE
jgi:hypothetical protein